MNSVKQTIYKPTTKLTCDLTDNEKYSTDYRKLKLYLKQGMKRNNTLYSFRQSPWLAEYKNHNTRLRTNAKTNIGKGFFNY